MLHADCVLKHLIVRHICNGYLITAGPVIINNLDTAAT